VLRFGSRRGFAGGGFRAAREQQVDRIQPFRGRPRVLARAVLCCALLFY
jgi:hypothetical protein